MFKGNEPSLRDFHTAVCIDDKMYLFGGRGTVQLSGIYISDEEIYSDELWYLDLKTLIWHNVIIDGIKPIGRRSHSACKLPGFCLTISLE